MDHNVAVLYLMTITPLICTPGPDLLFIISQGLINGKIDTIKAIAGILLGYSIYAGLSVAGISTIVSTFLLFFIILKWMGVAYLAYLSITIFSSIFSSNNSLYIQDCKAGSDSFKKGLLTSLLNPKGMLVYLSIVPQFIVANESSATQALQLSALFIAGCGFVYSAVGLFATNLNGRGVSNQTRFKFEFLGASMLALATVKLALDAYK